MYLEDEGKAPNSVQVYTSAIRRFYEYQNIVFKGKFLTNGTAAQSREINEKQLITPNKLKEILDISDPMEKAMYMIQLQTGLSSHELCNLRVKDIGDVKDGKVKLRIENGLIMLKLTREKTKVRFGTFFGYDGIEALKQWIDFRQRGKAREDKAISKGAIIKTNNDFIFVGYSKRYRKWDVITPTTYAGYLRNRVRQLGWISDEDMRKNGQLNVYRPHSLRMSFSEFMKHKAHVSWDIVEHWLGHKFSSTDKAYVQFGDEDLMNAYKQGESFLSITPIEPIVTDDRYRELKLKNDRLADKISILETREAEVTLREDETKKIWARIEKMEKKFAHLVETPAKIEETTERRTEAIGREGKQKR
jgi:integrase